MITEDGEVVPPLSERDVAELQAPDGEVFAVMTVERRPFGLISAKIVRNLNPGPEWVPR